ncbi:MAG: Rpn family recombination-promoting nuclease/putative transposase [Magnetococcales bacterium]|nr:Rpn family recombination-promoting nuclease/putative transposase [Magnetococcales bacterium]
MKQWERENQEWELLPAVVPFVFYHGSTEWRVPDEFLALVDAEAVWEPFLLNFLFPVLTWATLMTRNYLNNLD